MTSIFKRCIQNHSRPITDGSFDKQRAIGEPCSELGLRPILAFGRGRIYVPDFKNGFGAIIIRHEQEIVALLRDVWKVPKVPGIGGCDPCRSGLDRLVIEDIEQRFG